MDCFGCFDRKKTYLIFGTGTTGLSAVKFCQKHGLKFFIADDDKDRLNQIDALEETKLYKWNKSIMEDKGIDFLVLSPSVHTQKDKHKIVKIAEELEIEIIADIDLFYCYLKVFNENHGTKKQIIGITGTNGKSTTTALTAHIFNKLGESAVACGNIGLNYLALDVEKYELFVAEMSSYNLCLMKYAQFNCGCLLNITEDHLEYHGTMEEYIKAKEKLVLLSGASAICVDDEFCENIFNNAEKKELACVQVSKKEVVKNGLSWKDGNFYLDGNIVFSHKYENLIGEHNIENILCAIAVVILAFNNAEQVETNEIINNGKKEQITMDEIFNDVSGQIKNNVSEKLGKFAKQEGVKFDDGAFKNFEEKIVNEMKNVATNNIKEAEKVDGARENKREQHDNGETEARKTQKENTNEQGKHKNELGIEDIFNAVKSFDGLPHRMQFIKEIDGVRFVNDSKGTNANSTQQALRAYENKAVYLIAGGQRKTAGFEFLKDDLSCVKCVFLIGEATKSFAKELDKLGVKFEKCDVMQKAVTRAFDVARNDLKIGEAGNEAVVLLSPLCASWDQYKNFEARGDDFIKCVNELR